jgi:hypothetical protein
MRIGLGIGLGYSKESGSSVPAAPANVILPSLIGSGAVGTVVTCNRGSWSGSPSPTYTFNFLVDSISVQNTASNTYTLLFGDDTKTLTCVVTATNPLGSASATTSNSLVVGTVPVNTVAPEITPFDNQVIGTSLSATSGTWDGTPTLTFAYRWTRNNVPISGATSSTYTLQAADELQTIRVEVRAANAYATSSFVVSSNNAVGGYAPLNVSQPSMSLSGNQLVGTLVTVTNGTWSGTAPITFEYRWLRNGSPIGGATSSSYTLQSADDGNAVTAQVRALNAFGTSAYSTSNNTINAGTVPVNTVAPTVSPSGTQSTGTLITANVGTWSGTAPINYEYKWTRNGVAISGATASTYTIQLADDGTTIRVEVKGTNTYGTSAFIVSSNSVSAVNVIAPSNTVAPVISGTAVVGQTLTSTTGTWDGIPTPTYSYQWKRGVTNVGTNATTYTLVAADAGQSITCVVTATNAGGSANATSNALTVVNTLLDVYPSASSAYSVRLLRAARYNNALLRGRRSSDNAEVDIFVDSNYQLSLNSNITSRTSGTTLGTWAGANSVFVTTWYDQSGNNNNATQTTAANQPSIVVSGVLQTDLGKAALTFSGTTNLQATVNWTNLFSTYTVARLNSLSPAVQAYFRDNGAVNSTGVIAFNAPRVDTYRVRTSVVSLSQTNAAFGITTKLITLASDTTTGYAYLNNALQASNAVSGNVGTIMYIAANGIGNTGGIVGPMSEWITYPSNSNLSLINTNINTFYGIY